MWGVLDALRAAGHNVVVATGEGLCGRVRAAGFEAVALGPTSADEIATLAAGSAAPGARQRVWGNFAYTHLFPGAVAESRAPELIRLAAESDLVIHDVTDFAAPLAAALSGVPSVLHSWGPHLPAKTVARAGRVATALWTNHGLQPPEFGGIYGSAYLDICPPTLQALDATSPHKVVSVRPGVFPPLDGEKLPANIEKTPHEQTVHLTMGTTSNRSPELFRAVIDGLAALEVNVVVTTGPGTDTALLGPLPANVLAAAYLPLSLVLPRCSLVVSHGGAGTVLGAAVFGLPQVVLPQDADNARNAALFEAAGVAIVLPRADLEPSAVTAAARKALQESTFELSAKRLRAEIEAMPSPGAAVEQLVELAAAR